MHIGFQWETKQRGLLGRPRRRWEDNIKMNFKGIGWGGIAYSRGWSPNWVHSTLRPFTVLLCLSGVIVRMENYSVE
jgi:hypothetical protein